MIMISPKKLARRTSTSPWRLSRDARARQRSTEGAPSVRQPPHGVLDDDHRRIDDQPEVDRPEAHQVRRDVEVPHPDDGNEHRQRNRRRHNQSRAKLQQEQEQHRDDDQAALHQVRDGRPNRPVHQIPPVVEEFDRHPARDRLLRSPRAGPPRARPRLPAVLALQHHGDAQHRLALAVPCGRALSDLRPEPHRRHRPHVHRRAAARRQHDVLDVPFDSNRAHAANQLLLAARARGTRRHVLALFRLQRLDHAGESSGRRLTSLAGSTSTSYCCSSPP